MQLIRSDSNWIRQAWIFAMLIGFAGSLQAIPVVGQGGVLNAASFNKDGLPNEGIAQGAMFVVFGADMGPAGLVQAAGLPLPAELSGTSIEVTSGGVTVAAFVLYASAGQLAGVLPSNTPTGDGTLTVTYNGETSAPVTVKIVQSAFGIFTRNQAGFGPAIVQNFVSQVSVPLNSLIEAAHPGQVLILWGSGLGPIQGDDSKLPPVGNLPVNVEVIIGGRIAVQPQYAGRSPQFPAIDQINFAVPDGVFGCFVSIAIRVNGVTSNYGSISITPEGQYCDDPLNLRASDLMLAEQNNGLRIGTVTATTGGGINAEALGEFRDYTLDQLLSSTLGRANLQIHSTALGTCTVYTATGNDLFPEDTLIPQGLDAGGDLKITGPAGEAALEIDAPEGFFVPGNFTLSGSGGAEVGPINVTIDLTAAAALTAPGQINQISRSQDLNLSWTGVDDGKEFVIVIGVSEDRSAGVARLFVCSERGEAGQMTVPAEVLGSLPATVAAQGQDAMSIFAIAQGRLPVAGRFEATGIDVGLFLYTQLFAIAEPDFQ